MITPQGGIAPTMTWHALLAIASAVSPRFLAIDFSGQGIANQLNNAARIWFPVALAVGAFWTFVIHRSLTKGISLLLVGAVAAVFVYFGTFVQTVAQSAITLLGG